MGTVTNSLKTVVLLALLTALVLWIGNFLGGPQGIIIALFFVLIFNGAAFWWSDRIVLKMYKAQELPSSHIVVKQVRDVASRMNLPMPKVYIAPMPTPNAFATGRSPKHGAVCVTQGILDLLNERELKGVLAHEMSHIKNYDTLISVVAGMLAGVISYVAMMARFAAIFGGGRGNRGLLELLVLAIITPLIAVIIKMAVSRTREYAADESAARILQDGSGLCSALLKMERGTKARPLKYNSTTSATEHLFIINPFAGKSFLEFFSTHPSTAKRVARLESLEF